ncbi:hypothetical protein Loa_50p0044 (plasmid) [Legionella oakridgensis ATCC 33761 = DSM 21215]|uniref:Uncharacterized protein n=1 Tax=Legionella oakridgensis ATCC 33761 = DSM 21215 TaxID=1268635 RepID=W0BIR2_9GAMM|nr:hypothetical protein Loa_50p0044 [Legionella oakridgensis ATCC 33761 = DSM 21215]STY41412.1 Uncharacterised protein [Legionella longbeachae]
MTLPNQFILKLINTHYGVEAVASDTTSFTITLNRPCIDRKKYNYGGKII